MKNRKILILLISGVFTIASLTAQDNEKRNLIKFDGTLKTKYEWAFETSHGRFSVRNSRLGLFGEISPYLCYKTQIELSSNGKFEVLDLYATIKPVKGLQFTFGQSSIPLFNSFQTSPSSMLFANRSFVVKYNTGSRDIGLLATYNADAGAVPLSIELGVFNGSTINNPVWTGRASFAGRISAGGMQGLRATAKIHTYPYSLTQDYIFIGADLRYCKERMKFHAEVMNRHNKADRANRLTSHIEGALSMPLAKGRIFREIIPALRWDTITESPIDQGPDIHRITAGLGFGFTPGPFSSLLRIDYENYFVKNPLSEFLQTEENDSDKITVELMIVF
ncbi:MAG: hypothetical protein PHP30_01180 [Bacteroidales bacterium]|nr:hypothetical protein [Bacteroidales bacterium]MDD2424627.1 hypothetical protein [Bacteroidales bacterium]MDD3988699.1 hypothetical protein [Bacteroidales bacterium]MDD4639261.1 hypothetical protein [Bacteroidales bacterium]